MSVIYVCDGCGKQTPAVQFPGGLFKPSSWFERRDDDGAQHACSRECIATCAAKTGKTDLVLPL